MKAGMLLLIKHGWDIIAKTSKGKYCIFAKGDSRLGYRTDKAEILHSYKVQGIYIPYLSKDILCFQKGVQNRHRISLIASVIRSICDRYVSIATHTDTCKVCTSQRLFYCFQTILVAFLYYKTRQLLVCVGINQPTTAQRSEEYSHSRMFLCG